MSGKRISREKLTIKKMIDLYQAKCIYRCEWMGIDVYRLSDLPVRI